MTTTAIEHKYVTLSHGRTRYLEAGAGAPVILIHGAGYVSNADGWLPNLGPLSQGYRVLALDCLNWGLGDPFDQEFSFAYLVDFVREFQDALNIRRSHVVGHSMGGWIASLLAYESPNRVDKLVLVASGGMATRPLQNMVQFQPPPLDDIRNVAQTRARGAGIDPERLAGEYAAHLGRPEVASAFAKVMRHMTDPMTRQRYYMGRRLPLITAPTLIIWGADDKTNDVSMGQETQKLIANSKLIVYEGCGHMVPSERTVEFNRDVLAFLNG